jgi:hypothetical protein
MVGTGVGLVVGAAGRVPAVLVLTVAGFVLGFSCGAVLLVAGIRHWLAGRAVPVRLELFGLAAALAAGVVLYGFDGIIGGAMLAGLMGGILIANVWAIRAARANRDLVDAAEAAVARHEEAVSSDVRNELPADYADSLDRPLGQVLRENVGVERRRLLAWVIAGPAVLVTAGAFNAPEAVAVVVLITSVGAIVWVARRMWAAWLAERDFTRAATPPRRAFVVLINDGQWRPLMGIWSEPPMIRGGRMPKPERVYRCDDDRDTLLSGRRSPVVYEAWVDTGPRRRSKPRWVLADAGLALPHRRSLLGRWWFSYLLAGARPGPPQPLMRWSPHPSLEVHNHTGQSQRSFPAAVAGRFAGLAALGLFIYWLT